MLLRHRPPFDDHCDLMKALSVRARHERKEPGRLMTLRQCQAGAELKAARLGRRLSPVLSRVDVVVFLFVGMFDRLMLPKCVQYCLVLRHVLC
jgi:hypothetical protein